MVNEKDCGNHTIMMMEKPHDTGMYENGEKVGVCMWRE